MHLILNSELRSPLPYGVDCMFHCGGCPAMYHMLWQLHEHLQLHSTGGSYNYDHRTRTAFPKYEYVSHETQTDIENDEGETKAVSLVCTETQTEDSLTHFFMGRADAEESNENEQDEDANVQVKTETAGPEPKQPEHSNISDELDKDVNVGALTPDDPYSGDTDEDASLWYPDTDEKDSSDISPKAVKTVNKKNKLRNVKNFGKTKSLKKSIKEQTKKEKKRKHVPKAKDRDVLKRSSGKTSKVNDLINKKTPVQCKYCPEYFPNNLHLKRHCLQAHPSEKNHACRYCAEAFVTEIELQKHRKIHLREKYECRFCKKHLSSPQNLQDHITMHTGEKMFECKDCGTYFRYDDTFSGVNDHL